MLSVVIPIRNVFSATNECIELLITKSIGDIDIIVIDNASEVPYTYNSPFVRVIRNEYNAGFWPALLQGIEAAKYNIVMCMHNDVFIYAPAYDQYILNEFDKDPLLGMAGLFGGKGVGLDGGRGLPISKMIGKQYGTHGSLHGGIIDEPHPAVVFDSYCMIFNRDILYSLDYKDIPPYHWTDRIVTLRFVFAGYHALTLPIEHDHGGSFTAIGNNSLPLFTEEWCKQKGLELDQNWDYTLYMYGLEQFQREFRSLMGENTQLWVNKDYVYYTIGV